MSSFFTARRLQQNLRTIMNSNVQRALFYSKSRKYESTLEAALDGPDIPVSVYTAWSMV